MAGRAWGKWVDEERLQKTLVLGVATDCGIGVEILYACNSNISKPNICKPRHFFPTLQIVPAFVVKGNTSLLF